MVSIEKVDLCLRLVSLKQKRKKVVSKMINNPNDVQELLRELEQNKRREEKDLGGIDQSIAGIYGSPMPVHRDPFPNVGSGTVGNAISRGFARGMERQRRYAAIEQAEERRERVLRYWEEQNREIKEQLAKVNAQKAAKAAMRPQFTSYLEMVAAGTVDGDNKTARVNEMLSQYNKITGEDKEMISIDGNNPAIWTLRDRGKDQVYVMDMGQVFATDEQAAKEFSNYLSAAREKSRAEATANMIQRQDQLNQFAQDLDMRQKKLDLETTKAMQELENKQRKFELEKAKFEQKRDHEEKHHALADKKFEYEKNAEAQGQQAFVKEREATRGKKYYEYKSRAAAAANIVHRLKSMQSLARDNEWMLGEGGVFATTRHASVWATIAPQDGTVSIKDTLARQYLSKSKLSAVKEISKDYNNILYDRVNAQTVGRVTDKMLAMDQKGLPLPWEMTKESFNNTVNELIKVYEGEQKALLKEMASGDSEERSKKFKLGTMMTFPDGKIKFVPEDEIEKAEKEGAKHG